MQHPNTDVLRQGVATRQLGVPRSAARVLAACAGAAELCPDLPLRDEPASSAFAYLGGDAGDFDAAELRCTAFRACVLDGLARNFFERTPGALGVGVCSLLGTRGHRLDAPWVDIDTPDIAQLRRFILPERRGWMQLAACLCHSPWIDAVCGASDRRLLLVLDESVLPIGGELLMRILDEVSRRARAGSELLLAYDCGAPLRPARPFDRSSALELVLRDPQGGERCARYPRLRFVDDDAYPAELGTSVAGVNAVARLYRGVGAPALAHLRVV